jgi:hypothetical protein
VLSARHLQKTSETSIYKNAEIGQAESRNYAGAELTKTKTGGTNAFGVDSQQLSWQHEKQQIGNM